MKHLCAGWSGLFAPKTKLN